MVFDDSITTYGDVAKKYRIDFEQPVDMNTEVKEKQYQPLTVETSGDSRATALKPSRHRDGTTCPEHKQAAASTSTSTSEAYG